MYEYFITPFSSLICGISLRRIKVKFNWSLKYLTISLWIYFDTSRTDEQKYNIQMLTGLDQPGNCTRTASTKNKLLTRFFPCAHIAARHTRVWELYTHLKCDGFSRQSFHEDLHGSAWKLPVEYKSAQRSVMPSFFRWTLRVWNIESPKLSIKSKPFKRWRRTTRKRTIWGGLLFKSGVPSADQYVRGEHFEEVPFPGALGVHPKEGLL